MELKNKEIMGTMHFTDELNEALCHHMADTELETIPLQICE
jgi:hypothetical protein